MRREVPEPWASAMLERGLVYADRPSIRALARAAGIPAVEPVRRIVHGLSRPDPDTINKLADALGVSRITVSQWVGQLRTVTRPWEPPQEADLLTEPERAALDGLIRVMAQSKRASRAAVFGDLSGPVKFGVRDSDGDLQEDLAASVPEDGERNRRPPRKKGP